MDFLAALPTASAVVQAAINRVLATCGRLTDRRYPFGDPVSAESSHLALLRTKAYLLADKSDGVRAAIVLARTGAVFYAACIDRRGVMRALALTADEALFDGTVLDCELVCTRAGVHTFVAFDVACIAGDAAVGNAPLRERLETMTALLEGSAVNDVHIRVKRMFDVRSEGCEAAFAAYAASLDYATDGAILTPDQAGAPHTGTAPTILKLKDCHTIDFQWAGGELWFGDARELFQAHTLRLRFFEEELRHVPFGVIVEMAPDSGGDSQQHSSTAPRDLHFVQTRPDKSLPNTRHTVQRTLASVVDAITLRHVFESVSKDV
jgi:hypothetical protein